MSFLRKSNPISMSKGNRYQQRPPLNAAGSSSGNNTPRRVGAEKPPPPPAEGTYTDYRLVSTSRDTLHHVMRFHGSKEVNPAIFTPPVKLARRKNESNPYYRNYQNYYNKYNNNYNKNNLMAGAAGATAAAAGAAGAVTPQGPPTSTPSGLLPGQQPLGPTPGGADTSLISPYGGGVRNKQMLFKKRTRQIYMANEDERKKKEIESAPWVIEDTDNNNTWTGQLEGGQGANYVLFVFSEDGFKVVPADNWYTFSAKLPYATLTAEEAEEQYSKSAKQTNNIRWLMRNKKAGKGHAEGEEEEEEGGEGGHTNENKFMTVDHEEDEAGYDEDEVKDRKRKRGKHGSADEMDFDEIWQDDEEMPMDIPGFEEEDRDDPRKKQQLIDSDEDDDEEDAAAAKKKLTDQGKEIKKSLLKLEKNRVYASDDDEKDPYASDQDSSDSDMDEEKEKALIKKEETAAKEAQEAAVKALGGSAGPGTNTTNSSGAVANGKKKTLGNTTAKPGSALAPKKTHVVKGPVGRPPGSKSKAKLVAQAAATAAGGSSAGNTPVKVKGPLGRPPGAVQGRGQSPPAVKGSTPIQQNSNVSGSSSSQNQQQHQHAASSAMPPSGANTGPLDDSLLITENEVVSLLRSRTHMTTKDLITDFKKRLRKDERNRNVLSTIVKRVAIAKDGVLVLKEEFL